MTVKFEDFLNDFTASQCTYAILQLKECRETAYERFESFAGLKRQGKKPDRTHYNVVYAGKEDPVPPDREERLEKIYCIFNMRIPDGFTGHSLSVSDIVILKENSDITYNYVDSIGFKELDQF